MRREELKRKILSKLGKQPTELLSLAKKLGKAKQVWLVDDDLKEIIWEMSNWDQLEITRDWKIKKI
jgi:hypothetical protein